MVKVRPSSHARLNRDLLERALDIFGKSLTLQRVTETIDNFGQLSAISTANSTFRGDLQFGLDLDQRHIQSGFVEVGDAILYIHPTESGLSSLPSLQDLVIDGNSVWRIEDQIESPELDGTTTHISFRCKREINTSDS